MAKVEVSAEDLQLILDNTRVTSIDGAPVYQAILRARRELHRLTHPGPAPGPLAAAGQAMMAADLDLVAFARMEADVVRYRQESRGWQRKCLEAQEALSTWSDARNGFAR